MRWSWEKFGSDEPERGSIGHIRAVFERLLPEVADGTLKVVAVSREPDAVKVAVAGSSLNPSRPVGIAPEIINRIRAQLGVKILQIIPWSNDPELLIPNALQPAEVQQVLLCDMLGRAIVLVSEDQLQLAIGRRGQNVRLASKLCGWDIEIMTSEEMEEQIDQAVIGFSSLDGVEDELAQRLVEQGYLSYDDLAIIEPDALMEMGDLTADRANAIIEQAELKADEDERP